MNSFIPTLSLGLFAFGQTPTQAPTTPTPATQTPVQTPYSLKYAPVEGTTTLYKLTGSMDIQGGTATFDSKVALKVLKVDPDGTYSMQHDTLEGKVVNAGTEMQMQKNSTVTIYKPSGEVVSITGNLVDQSEMRSANLTLLKRPENPVKPGDTWSFAIKADSTAKSPSVQGTFTFDGEEAVGNYHTLKIDSKVAEGDTANPGSVIGSFWINKDDGSMVKWDCKYTNMTFPGTSSPLSGTFSMLRLDK